MLWKLLDWTVAADAAVAASRRFVFYGIMNALATELKSLFVPYMPHLLSGCVDVLQTSQRKPKKGRSDADAAGEFSQRIVNRVMTLLHACCVHDVAGFVTEERFSMLQGHIAVQVKAHAHEDSEAYRTRIEDVVAPCVAMFAVACNAKPLWKELNDGILAHCLDTDSRVRRGTLRVLDAIYKQLGNEFVSFLPDTVPHLVELMEDDEAEVEDEVRRLVKTIESYLGESLSGYLN